MLQPLVIIQGILLLAAISNTLFAIRAFFQTRYPRHVMTFALLYIATAIYASGYLFELSTNSYKDLYFALAYEYLGLAFLPAIWILLVREFSGKHSSLFLKIILILPSIITLGLVFTLPLHQFYYRNLEFSKTAGMTIISFERAPWYWVQSIYLNIAFLFGTVVLLREVVSQNKKRRFPAVMMFVGSLFPWIAYISYLTGIIPYSLETGSIALSLAAPFFAFGFFKFRFFELSPLARDTILEQMQDAVIVLDSDGYFADMNKAATRIQGFEIMQAKQREHLSEVLKDHQDLEAAYKGTRSKLDIPLTSDGEQKMFDLSVTVLKDKRKETRGEVLILKDSTERALLTEKLNKIANTDELTGLISRRQFLFIAQTEMTRAKRYGRPIAVAILDMDKFKQINDNHGHLAGDNALKLFAKTCSANLRKSDVLGRIGGDEFAILLPETDDDCACKVLHKLRDKINESHLDLGNGKQIPLSVSYGWAGSKGPDHPELDELFALADSRLYECKRQDASCPY